MVRDLGIDAELGALLYARCTEALAINIRTAATVVLTGRLRRLPNKRSRRTPDFLDRGVGV